MEATISGLRVVGDWEKITVFGENAVKNSIKITYSAISEDRINSIAEKVDQMLQLS